MGSRRQAPREHRQPSPQPPRRVPLRFLNLPGLVQENILKRVDLFDVVSLSLCSTRATNCVNAIPFLNLREPEGLLTGAGVHVDFTKDHVSVVFQDKISKYTLRVQASEDVEDHKDVLYSLIYKKVEKSKSNWWSYWLGRRDIVPVLQETHWVADYSPSQFNEAAKRAVEHICYIFRLPVIRVSVNVEEIPNFTSLFIWDLLRGSCPDVRFYSTVRHWYFIGPDIYLGDILNAEVTKFFRKFRIEKRFALEVKNPGRMYYQFSKLRNLDFLVLHNASWMKDHHLKQLNLEYLEVHNTEITKRGVNTWLKKWMNSSDTKTKVLVIGGISGINYGITELLKGIPYERLIEQKKAFFGKFGSFARYFYENTDGTLRQSPNRTVFKMTRADGAVVKVANGNELCAYMTYKN